MVPLPLALGMPGTFEMMVIGGIALLLFGKRLPDVARGFGKSIVEFKKGIKGIDEDVQASVDTRPAVSQTPPPQQHKLDNANQV